MEKSFLIRTDEYMTKLRSLGIWVVIAMAILNGSLNMSWNIDAIEGRLAVTEPYLATLLGELLLFFLLSLFFFEIILLRLPAVKDLKSNAGAYKVTLSNKGVVLFLPLKEIGYSIPYANIKRMVVTESIASERETVTIYCKGLPSSKGAVSFYIATRDILEFRQSFESLSGGMRLKSRKEYLLRSILVSYDLTKPKKVKR